MATLRYDVGDKIRTTFPVVNQDGTAVDPTTVSLTVNYPSAGRARTSITYTYASNQVEKVSTGIYRTNITFDYPGVWHLVWAGTGTAVVSEEISYVVRQRRAAPLA